MRTVFLLMTAMTFSLLGCNAQSDGSGDVTVAEAKQMIAESENLVILDVRTDEEVAGGMIDGAIQIDISKPDFESRIEALDKGAPVLVYCKSGGRSKRAQEIMEAKGFEEIHNLAGGYTAFSRAK